MRPTITNVIFLIIALFSAIVTTVTAQELDKPPIIAAVERSDRGEILIRAIVVGGCIGNYKVVSSLGPNIMDLSGMKTGQTRLFATGWYSRPGEYTVMLTEVESMPTTDCPSFPAGRFRLDKVVMYFTQDNKLDNTRRLAGMYVTDTGKRYVSILNHKQVLSFAFRLTGEYQTQVYGYQVFPNGTVTVENDLIAKAPSSADYYVLNFSTIGMFGDKPIYFIASSGGYSTSGVIFTP
jgi:hypothetical protein